MIAVGMWGSISHAPSSDEQRKGLEFPGRPVLWVVAPAAARVFGPQSAPHALVHFGQPSPLWANIYHLLPK